MLKIASKFAIDIIPSVIATIIGAYIVNHYIVSKPTDAPTAAVVSPATPKKADVANVPEPGVRAKGISEKSVIDKSNTDRATVEKPVEKPAEKAADKPAETASIPPDTRRHPTNSREKTVAKVAPDKTSTEKAAPEKPVVPVIEPVVSAPTTAPAVEAAIAPDRDANDLARAAIERLRATPDSSRPSESSSVRLPDPPRVVTATPAAPITPAPSLQPLPPPILVSTPLAESAQPRPSSAGRDDPRRPTPPADIPDPRPLDLRADAIPDQPPKREHTNVAEDVLSAAKSMFHSVLPNNSTK
jgi:hypothetical protein